jgi:uncharacterized protein (TIGR04255 family)
MQLKKPPVVETWISFDFHPNENKRGSNLAKNLPVVQEYVRQYATELPKLEAIHEKQIQVQETSPTDLPKVVSQEVRLQSVRLTNEARSRVLQLGDDRLSYHVLKTDEGYPGYTTVRAEAQQKLEDYIRFFQPSGVRTATLHYLDIIDVPCPAGSTINLADYFRMATDLPEQPFGMTSAISFQFQAVCPVDPGPLLLQLQTIPAPPQQRGLRFRLEWHKLSTDVNTLEFAEIWRRLDVAHRYLTECFQASLTQRTIELFDPVEET